jgi:hypothetical protein
MDYADWIRDRYERGVPIERIAEAALTGPVMLPGGAARVAALLQNVAAEMQVALSDVHIVGSARYGFSLRDGAAFDPAFSDLDLAVVDAGLHARCVMATNVSPRAARFPEKDLPVGGRIAVRRVFDDLSRSVADQFAYVSVAVFPDLRALIETQAGRIGEFLGVRTVDATPSAVIAAPDLTADGNLPAIAERGLPRFVLPVADSTPFNASPWLADHSMFFSVFGSNASRQSLLHALQNAFQDLSQIVELQCCLVGGSFVDLFNPAPNDIDIVAFYRVPDGAPFEPGRALHRLSRKFLLARIDMRFVPCDAEPRLLVKLTSFFTSLYYADRSGTGTSRGLVLLVPDARTDRVNTPAKDGRCDERQSRG